MIRPRISEGLTASYAGELGLDGVVIPYCFDHHAPKIKRFYDTYLEKLTKTFTGNQYTASWIYLIVNGTPYIITGGMALASLVDTNRKLIKEAEASANELAKKGAKIEEIIDNASSMLEGPLGKERLAAVAITNVSNFVSNNIKPIASILALILSAYKINNIFDIKMKSNNLLNFFNTHNFTMIAHNLAEYITFRFEGIIQKLESQEDIDRFAEHFVESLTWKLLNTTTPPANLDKMRQDIIQYSIQAHLDRPELLSRPSFGTCCCPTSFWPDRKLRIIYDKHLSKHLSYRQIKYHSPITYFEFTRDGNALPTDYTDNDRRDFFTVNNNLPKQKIIFEFELIDMGFNSKKSMFPKAKL